MTLHQFLVSRELGGVSLIVLRFARWLTDRGEATRIWVPGEGQATKEAEQEGLTWHSYNLDAMTRGVVSHTLACLRLVPALRRRAGLAHVYTPTVYRLLRPALRLARLRTVVHVQIDPEAEDLGWAFQDPPDVIVVCARSLAGTVRAALGARGADVPVVVVPNAVDTERFSPTEQGLAKRHVGAPTDRPLVLMLANLAPHKGQETTLQAVAELKGRGRAVECWLAGGERGGGHEYEARLRTLADDLGVADRVRFLGFRTDGPELLRAADFLLLPSTREGLPFAVLEAQASKTAVLAAPTAGIPEVVRDGATGFLVPAGDALGYASRLQLLLDNPGLYQRITDRAYDQVRHEYSWKNYCQRVAEVYRNLTLPKSPAPRPGSFD